MTSSPITRLLAQGVSSAIRTTLTSAPFVTSPLASDALNVASPHRVGGYVLRIPKLGDSAALRPKAGVIDGVKVDREFKVIPTDGSHRRVRLELLLAEISGGQLISFRTG